MITLSKTYETWDEEALEIGETDERGFEYEDQTFTFKELVQELEGYIHPSIYPADSSCWVTAESEADIQTGDITTYSLHFNGPENKRKYWEKALRYHGLIKEES